MKLASLFRTNQILINIKTFTKPLKKACLINVHRITTTILRKTIPKGNPKTIRYREYKSFDEELTSTKKKNGKLQL